MSGLVIFRSILEVAFGLGIIVIMVVFKGPAYVILLGLGLSAWGAIDMYRELRDKEKESEVSKLSQERDMLRKEIHKED